MISKSLNTSLPILVTPEFIGRRIFLIREQKVMLDNDLAELYQVSTKTLNQAVKRNAERFPFDFMFQLDTKESGNLNRSQFVTGSQRHRDPRFRPYAFTELGVAMLSSVLNSEKAVQMNIFIMRAFMKLRELLATHRDLAQKIEQLEKAQKKQGRDIISIIKAINEMDMYIDKLENAQTPKNDAIGYNI